MPLMHEPSLSRYSKTNFRHTNWRSYSVWCVSVCSIPLLARCLRGYARAKLQVCTGRCPRCRQRSRRTRIRGILGWEWKDLNGGNTNDRLLSAVSGVRIPPGRPYLKAAKPPIGRLFVVAGDLRQCSDALYLSPCSDLSVPRLQTCHLPAADCRSYSLVAYTLSHCTFKPEYRHAMWLAPCYRSYTASTTLNL